jgi:hypothetical protein
VFLFLGQSSCDLDILPYSPPRLRPGSIQPERDFEDHLIVTLFSKEEDYSP